MSAWWENYHASLPQLDPDTRRSIEYITGGIPLLLQSLLQFKNEEFDHAKFLESTELALVQSNVTFFYQRRLRGSLTDAEREE
jgi:hypothetical protein